MNTALRRFGWPVLLTAAALGLRMLLNPWLGDRIPYGAFYISVTLSAILGGALPGFIAIALGMFAAIYFFVPPVHTLAVPAGHPLVLCVDFGVSIVLVMLADRQRRAAAKAAEGWRMLGAVMEFIPEGLTIMDADGRVRMLSRHGAEMLGKPRGPLGPTTVADYVAAFYHPDGKTPARLEEMVGMRAIRDGEISGDVEWMVKRPDGGTAAVLSRGAPIRDNKGRIVGSVAAWRDITERKRLEQKLHESARLESLGVLAGGIAHDFNNLLTSVLGHSSLLMNDLPEGSTDWQSVQEISKAAERAARLSRQMLSYSGRGRFLVEPLNLSEFLGKLVPKIGSSIPKYVQLKADLADDLPAIQADSSQIKELTSNLVCNGVESIGPSGGHVTVATRVVTLDHQYTHAPFLQEEILPGTYVALDVSDTGSGIPEDNVARIFDPFFTTKFLGRGLGLAAAQGIVRGHNGKILVYSHPGDGTTISILFPVAGPGVSNDSSSLPPDVEAGSETVLVIDNEEIIRSSVSEALSKLGYPVVTVADGTEGLRILEALQDKIAVVLLDMTLPGTRGEEILRELQRIRPDVSIVLSGPFGEAEARRRFGRYTAAGYLQKPYSWRMLAERVSEASQSGLPIS